MGLEERAAEKDIDGTRYKSWPLPFGVGRKALTRLIKILSPVLSVLANDKNDIAGLFSVIPTVLSDEDVDYFADVFGKASQYQNGSNWVPLLSAAQDMHFAGKYSTFVKWLVMNMEVNFADFFHGKDGAASSVDLLGMFKAKS